MFSITLTALAATAAALAPTGPPPPAAAAALLSLTVTTADGQVTTARLRCGPTGGDHQEANAACAALSLVAGDFTALQANTAQACTLEYDPVTASATGHWRGRQVRFEQTFPNTCALTTRTGPVFALTPAGPA